MSVCYIVRLSLVLCLAGGFFATPAMAQMPNSLELGDLVVHLLETHERIQAAQAAVESADFLADRAQGLWLPKVDVFMDGGYETIDVAKRDVKSTSKFRNEQNVKVTQKILDFGATDGVIDTYKALGEEAETRLDRTRQELITRGVQAYLSVIRGREMVRFAKKSEQNIKRLSGMQEALVERGAGLSYEDLQVKGQLAGAQARLVNMQRSLTTALNNFRAVYGLELGAEQVDALKMPAVPLDSIPDTLDECIAISQEENLQIVELRRAVERTEGQVQSADAQFYPTVDFVGKYARKEQDQGVQGVRYETKGGLQLNYTLFNGGGDTNAARAARADLTSARKSVLDRGRAVEKNVRNAWLDLNTLKKNMELYETQANITWEFLSLVNKKKSMGAEVGLLDILVGERDYINAISAKVGAEIDYNISAYTLLYHMGRMNLQVVGM